MSAPELTDELLNRTFELAYFILGDRTAAIYLTAAAVDKLKIASAIQSRRLYYVPTGRTEHPASRTKVSLSRLHLLQRLIYAESELFERLSEGQGGPLRQHDMIVRFVKHLVMATTRRNSFYVALGLCRLLHNYTTAETAEIYDLVIQNPDRSRDDYYYRSRKKRLMGEIKARFDGSIKTYRLLGREERFRPQEDAGKYAELIGECLSRFTPWGSPCVLPAEISPLQEVTAPLLFNGGDPDQEHEIEINRIHTLLHPACMERLTAALGLDPPARRLDVPLFFNASDDRGLRQDRFHPQPLAEGEMAVMRHYFERNAALRHSSAKRVLSVFIGGSERVSFEPARAAQVNVRVPVDSEWLEVRGVEGDLGLPLALHALPFSEEGTGRAQSSVVAGEGYKLSFSVRPPDSGGSNVSVSFSRTGADGLLSSLQRLIRSLPNSATDIWTGLHSSYLYLAFCSLLITVFAAGLLLFLYRHAGKPSPAPAPPAEREARHDAGDTKLSRPTAPAAPVERQSPPTNGADTRKPEVAKRTVPRKGWSPVPRGTPSAGLEDDYSAGTVEENRGRKPEVSSKDLLAVRKVYVDPLDGGAAGQAVRQVLAEGLRSSARFTVVENRVEADAVFKGHVEATPRRGGRLYVSLRLVNYEGAVIWSGRARVREGTDQGGTAGAAESIIRDLFDEVRKREGPRQ